MVNALFNRAIALSSERPGQATEKPAEQADEDLALAVQRGDAHSLSALVERHHSPLLGYLYRMTGGNRPMAEDLVQEAFLRALKSIRGYRYPRPFKAWLYAIATNLARDHYKSAEIRYTHGLSPKENDVAADSAPEDEITGADDARQVAVALSGLPDGQREVVILRYYQELSLAEIADILEIPVGTVKSRLSLGLGRLRVLLTQESGL